MVADFFTKPLQGRLFYQLRDLIMNIAPHSEYHSSRRSVLKDVPRGVAEQTKTATEQGEDPSASDDEWVEVKRRGRKSNETNNRAHSKENT